MPAELLRDLFQSSDVRPARRLSMVPVSIGAHIAAALAMLIIPLAAEVEPPTPAPLARPAFMKARAIPPAPAPVSTGTPVTSTHAAIIPTSAPDSIAPERPSDDPVEGAIPGPPSPGPVGVTSGIQGGDLTTGAPPAPPPPPPPPQPPALVRAGHGVREPKKIVNVMPEYPSIARSSRIEGMVILEAVIDERGVVDRIRILKSVTLLDGAAIDAVRRWRYTPTLLNGVPVSVLMTITVNFTLNQ